MAITECEASNNQDDYFCNEAYDGIRNVLDNGWAYSAISPAWVIFQLAQKSTINSLTLISGQKRNDHRLITFKVSMNDGINWVTPIGLFVREAPNALIGDDATITLNSETIQLPI